MKFAIMADVHANLEAFQAVLEDAKEQRCTHYAFLGDFVGYCADPKACIDIVRAMNAPCVKGEHDEYCATEMAMDGYRPIVAKSVEWTRKQLSVDDRNWLRQLPLVRAVEDFTIVHATLDTPERWAFVFDRLAAASSLAYQSTSVCFFGHTHIPMAVVSDGIVRGGTYTKFETKPRRKYFVNVGSVGLPRDGDPRAAYVIYNMDESSIELCRLDYDIPGAQKRIFDAGLPPRMAERLAMGK
jgi:predicted phosphodiesterase